MFCRVSSFSTNNRCHSHIKEHIQLHQVSSKFTLHSINPCTVESCIKLPSSVQALFINENTHLTGVDIPVRQNI